MTHDEQKTLRLKLDEYVSAEKMLVGSSQALADIINSCCDDLGIEIDCAVFLQEKMEELLPHCAGCGEFCEDGRLLNNCEHYMHSSCLLLWYSNKTVKNCTKCPSCLVPLGKNICCRLRRKNQYKKLVKKARCESLKQDDEAGLDTATILLREQYVVIDASDRAMALALQAQFDADESGDENKEEDDLSTDLNEEVT